jgi:hypothetical protein
MLTLKLFVYTVVSRLCQDENPKLFFGVKFRVCNLSLLLL